MRFVLVLLVLAACSKPGPELVPAPTERNFSVVNKNVTVEGEVFKAEDLASEKARVESSLLLAE